MDSYTFRDAKSLPEYQGEGFTGAYDPHTLTRVYRFDKTLATLPEVPENHRLMVLDEDMVTCYDSLMGGEYKKQDKGYLILV